jgi:hypothetical protein
MGREVRTILVILYTNRYNVTSLVRLYLTLTSQKLMGKFSNIIFYNVSIEIIWVEVVIPPILMQFIKVDNFIVVVYYLLERRPKFCICMGSTGGVKGVYSLDKIY